MTKNNAWRRVAALALALVLALPPALTLAADRSEIDAQVDRIFRNGKTTGGSVIIARHGEIVYARDYGMKDVRRRLPVDERTFFRLNSVTKMVSGMGALQLVEQGLLDLDADISDYYGYRIVNPHAKGTPLTLRQAMSHTLGLNENSGYSSIRSTVYSMLSADSKKKSNFLDRAPGSRYAYSNFGAGLVGSMMEAVTGVSVNRYMADHVFSPLGIEAAYSASLLANPEDVPGLYRNGKLYRAAGNYTGETYEDFADPERHYRTTVYDLWIRSRDLAKIAILLCGDGSYQGIELLSPATIDMMRQDQSSLGKSVTGASPYGLFLERNTFLLPGRTIYGHQGMGKNAIQNVYFDPETQFVFVLLTNGCSLKRDNRVGVLALNMFRYLYPIFTEEQLLP